MSVERPGKLIEVNVTSVTGIAAWPFDDGLDDPWFIAGNPYRWRIVMTISGETHSSHVTREEFVWNGLDIRVGDYVAGRNEPVAVRIYEVENKTISGVTALVEDVDRFNTFNDPTGNGLGIFGEGLGIVFELGDDGLPILNPLPTGIGANLISDLTSRFRINNPIHRYRVEQPGHSFVLGEQVSITPSGYVKASVVNDKITGYITDIGPGPDIFFYKPITKIAERHFPALPGGISDFIYVDENSPGDLDNLPSGLPLFIKLTLAIPAEIRGTVANPTSTVSTMLVINGITITFTGTDLATIVSDIDGETSSTGIDASVGLVESTTLGSLSGPFTAITPTVVVFSINGTSISLTTDDAFAGFSLISDMVTDINALLGTHGVTASDDSGKLRLTDLLGGAITIVDIDPAAPTGGSRKSFTEATGLLDAPASTDEIIVLTAADGRELILQNGATGDALGDLGLYSVDNGQLPIGLVMEQGIRKGEMFVVDDITARDALVPKIGDQAFVIDAGQEEWALFVWVNDTWILFTNENASDTDAETISIIVNWDDPSTNFIHRVSDGSRILFATVKVLTPFDGTTPTLTIGDSLDNSRFMSSDHNDLTDEGTYNSTPSFQYDTGGLETEIFAYFAGDGSLAGSAKVTISYT